MNFEFWHHWIGWGILAAGVGQILLVLASPAIPVVLKWRDQFRMMQPLSRQVFWTYAAYILVTNLFFGMISLFGREILLDGSALAATVCGFLAAWWIGRIVIQCHFLKDGTGGKDIRLAEIVLAVLFAILAVVYSAALLFNLLPNC